MLSFKEFRRPKGTIPVPIHFKYITSPEDKFHLNLQEGRVKLPSREEAMKLPRIDQDYRSDVNWNQHVYDSDHGLPAIELPGEAPDVQHTLIHARISHILEMHNKFTDDQHTAVYNYTRSGHSFDSQAMNRKLIEHGSIDQLPDLKFSTYGLLKDSSYREAAKHIQEVIHNNRLKHTVNTMSGLGFDPDDIKDDKGRLRSPAFISTTHDQAQARHYGRIFTEQGEAVTSFYMGSLPLIQHLMHFHLQPGDNAIGISGHSRFNDEREVLVNAGAVLQHHGHKDYFEEPEKPEPGNMHLPPKPHKILRVHHVSLIREE